MQYRHVASGGVALVLPATVAATERVHANQAFRFDLAPGEYVLYAKYDGGARSYLEVTVRAGRSIRAVMPDLCR